MKSLTALLLAILLGASAPAPVELGGRSVLEAASSLKTGDFIWAPELAPQGPALLVVNVDTQRAVLFRNGVPIAATTLSTGRPGYDTPTGVFTILQKHVEHYSNKYDNAPMPFMQRLTWTGVALHAGHLPGYPASHGCIRLPKEFARLLYGVTKLGMTVVITQLPTALKATNEIPLAAKPIADANIASAPFRWNPGLAPTGMTSVIVSVADQRAIVLRGGTIIGSAPVRVTGPVDGAWAYLLHRSDKDGRHWLKLKFDGDSSTGMEVAPGEAARFQLPDGFREAVIPVLRPGSMIVVTPAPLRFGNIGAPAVVIEDEPPTSD